VKDEIGVRRLDNPDDFVTIEIATALDRKIRVIPVLVDNARMPRSDKLPDTIKTLVRRNAVELRNAQFRRAAETLVAKIREVIAAEVKIRMEAETKQKVEEEQKRSEARARQQAEEERLNALIERETWENISPYETRERFEAKAREIEMKVREAETRRRA